MRKKIIKDKNSKDYLYSSVSGSRGKSVLDFMENFTNRTTTYKKNKRGKYERKKV